MEQATWTRVLGMSCVINPTLNAILIPQFQQRLHNGAIGAALSLLMTELIQNGVGLWVVRSYLQRETLVRLGRSGIATLGMAGVVLSVAHLGLAAQILGGGFSFIVLGLLVGLATPDERHLVQGFLDRWPIASRLKRLLAW